MKNYYRFLAYYSFIVATLLFVSSIFFFPKPQNIAFAILFLPVTLFFWVRISSGSTGSTSPQPGAKIVTMILAAMLLSSVSIFAYSLRENNFLPTVKTAQEETLTKIAELQNDIKTLQTTQPDEQAQREIERVKERLAKYEENQVLGKITTSTPPQDAVLGQVQIANSKWKTLDVFTGQSTSSRVLAQIDFGKTYNYYQKEDSWYRLKIDSQDAWINAQFVKEVILP